MMHPGGGIGRREQVGRDHIPARVKSRPCKVQILARRVNERRTDE